MKKTLLTIWILCLLLSLCACSNDASTASVVATTKPVYDFTQYLCQGTDIAVEQLISENLSCLHDYTLQVRQMRAIEGADVVIISGAGLEDFLEDALQAADHVIDSSEGISLLCSHHDSEAHSEHQHDEDPHIWLDISNAKKMAYNICQGLIAQYPHNENTIKDNMSKLEEDFTKLQKYGSQTLSGISYRELVTFHDGFHYFADYWELDLLRAIEEEPGSEASAGELIEIIDLLEAHNIPAIFTEENGSSSASGIISEETGIPVYELSTCMADVDYFEAMRNNIDTIKEALE